MSMIVELTEYRRKKELSDIGVWCIKNLGYLPEAQVSRIVQCFKLRTKEDMMAFKLRWS